MEIPATGMDIAKRAFQAHGEDASDKAVLRRKLQRTGGLSFFGAMPSCLSGIEECASCHSHTLGTGSNS